MTAGFKIGDDEFPIPTTFTLADGPLVFDASGLKFAEFGELLENPEEGDIRPMAALVAVAVSRQRPHWNRRRVVQFLSTVDLESLATEGGEEEIPPALPPETAAENPSPGSSTASTTSQEDTSGAPV